MRLSANAFLRFWLFSPPPLLFTPCPYPLPPCFSGCIPLAFPSHSPRAIPSHSPRIRFSCAAPSLGCRGVGVSGRLGVSGCLDGSGVWVSALGGCSPSPLAQAACPKTCPPPPLLPPSPRGGLIKFAAAPLSGRSRVLVLRPPQSVCSNQIVNVPPLIGEARQPKLILLV